MLAYPRYQNLIWFGGVAGLVPFYASLIGYQILGWQSQPFVFYSAIILSFLCGAVWRFALASVDDQVLVSGLVLALMVPAVYWLSIFLAVPDQLGVGLLGFLLIYGWERRFAWCSYPAGYRILRTVLTTLVAIAHLGMLL